jgi:hypothetical protein
VAEHLLWVELLPRFKPLNAVDWAVGLVVTTVFAVGVGRVIGAHWAALHGQADVILLTLFVVGPRTVMAAGLWRRRASPQLMLIALVLNLHGALATLCVAIFLHASAAR